MDRNSKQYQQHLEEKISNYLNSPADFATENWAQSDIPQGQYEGAEDKDNMFKALALWSVLDKKSRFYDSEWQPTSSYYSHYKVVSDVVKTQRKKIFNQLLVEPKYFADNPYLERTVLFWFLPKAVIRQWLWHENVDFQSRESFLRRMTKEQHESLVLHHQLLREQYGPDLYEGKVGKSLQSYNLPCFTKGVVNKLYNFFGLKRKLDKRRVSKSAIAYDFFGAGLGFALYPNKSSDEKADQALVKQFHSTNENRGAFVVNQESGLYFWLYKTMFKNDLYSLVPKDEEVVLGSRICPGAWATASFWTFLLVVSPLCLLLAGLQDWLTRDSWTILWLFGSVSPVFGGLVLVKKLFKKIVWLGKSNQEFYEYVDVLSTFSLIFGLSVIIFSTMVGLVEFGGLFLGMVFVISMLILVAYCWQMKTLKFWSMPYLGKSLPLLFLATLLLSQWSIPQIVWGFGFVLTQVFLTIATFLVKLTLVALKYKIIIFLFLSWYLVFKFGLWFAERSILAKGLIKWRHSFNSYRMREWSLVVLVITFFAPIFLMYLGGSGAGFSLSDEKIWIQSWAIFLSTSFFLLVFSYQIVSFMLLEKFDPFKYCRDIFLRLDYPRFSVGFIETEFFQKGDLRDLAKKRIILKEIVNMTGPKSKEWSWMFLALGEVKSMSELENLRDFIALPTIKPSKLSISSPQFNLSKKFRSQVDAPNEKEIPFILNGVIKDYFGLSIKRDKPELFFQENQVPILSENLEQKISQKVAQFFVVLWSFLVLPFLWLFSQWKRWILRPVLFFLTNVWHFFGGLKKFCPQSPKSRGLVK